MSDTTAHFHFYGRRKGKTLRRHHMALMQELLPRLQFDPAVSRISPDRPTWLEIGFGGGEHLAHQARSFPDVDFIGAEPFQNGVAKLLAFVEAQDLSNIRIYADDVRYLLQALPPASLDKIFVLYPDPWPKTRHHERRIVNADTLRQFHQLLKPGGLFLFASDIANYIDWTLGYTAMDGGFALVRDSTDPYDNWIETRYEAKAKREGRSSRYLTYQRKAL